MSKGKLLEIVIFDNIKIDCIVHDEFITETEIIENIKDELIEIFGTKENIAKKLYYVEILEPSKNEPFSAVFFANLDSKTYYYGTKGNQYRIHGINKEEALIRKKNSYNLLEEPNIIKKTCKELGLTYAQLAEQIGYSESNLNKVASTGQISNQLTKVIELYLENLKLKKELENSNKIKQTLKEWLN